jgi:hypothetical protein
LDSDEVKEEEMLLLDSDEVEGIENLIQELKTQESNNN